MPAVRPDPVRDPVFAACVVVLRRNLPFTLAGMLLTMALVIAALQDVVPHAQLAGGRSATWRCPPCAGMPCAASGRSRASPASTTTRVRRWRRITLVGCWPAAWGLPTAYWLQHVPLPHQMFLIIALLTMGTGAIYAYCIDLPVLYSFLLPYFLPMLLMLTMLDQTLLTVMGVAGLLYAVSLTFAHRMHRTQLDSLSLRFENLDLLQRLQNEKMAAERSDRQVALPGGRQPRPAPARACAEPVRRRAEGHALPAQSRQLVDSISRAVQALGGLFDGLLNLSRLDAGVVRPQVQPVAIADVLDRLHHEFAPQAQAKSLRLRVRPLAATVSSDPALLDRILRNLIHNAVHHTERGGVLIGCRRDGDALRVEVWDSGPGIPLHEQERVFWEFHQLGNPERDRSKGLGLGLAIVQRTARLLGHELGLRSWPGRGTVFSLTLPLADPQAQAPAQADEPQPAALPAHAREPLVLVIEDDVQSRLGLQLLLEGWGYRVLAAGSVEELLLQTAQDMDRVSLIISDYRLREHQTGIDAIKRLHEEYNDEAIPALLVSGDTDPQRRPKWPNMAGPCRTSRSIRTGCAAPSRACWPEAPDPGRRPRDPAAARTGFRFRPQARS